MADRKGRGDALGTKVYVMNDHPDGFNINTECGSTHIEHLQKFVVENGLDDTGRILVRESDTELVIRMMVEAKT